MDRTQAFAEYSRILDDFEDSLSGGFRRSRPDAAVHPPEMRSETIAAPVADAPQEPVPNPVVPAAPGEPGPVDAPPRPAPVPVPPASRPGGTPLPPADNSELGKIASEISECRGCNLYLLRENTVPGAGNAGSTLMIVTQPPVDNAVAGAGPLANTEQEYLERWLAALGLDPARDVFITPAVKCRTPGGRAPQAEEAAACTGFLRRQYKAVAPRAVLALGSSACGALTGDPSDFPSLVGRDWNWGAVPALVLWTPAEVLANPGRLRKPVWDALQRLKAAWNAVPGTEL